MVPDLTDQVELALAVVGPAQRPEAFNIEGIIQRSVEAVVQGIGQRLVQLLGQDGRLQHRGGGRHHPVRQQAGGLVHRPADIPGHRQQVVAAIDLIKQKADRRLIGRHRQQAGMAAGQALALIALQPLQPGAETLIVTVLTQGKEPFEVLLKFFVGAHGES